MSILNIRPAVRAGSKVVIGIAGTSGSGKTYTALKVARGMVSSPSDIGFIDTENRRGSLYADILDGQFMIGDLYPPFSPTRYADAIKEFQAAGVKVLVIDSISHEWEGEGGCEDIATNTSSKMANWKLAKKEHKKFMNALLQSDMHIVACIRAREKTDFKNPKQPVSLGIQPICEKNFMFEMTASMMMHNEGFHQQFLKMPESLRQIFGNGEGYLSESHGSALINWVDSGENIDADFERAKSDMQMACESGLEFLKAQWVKMPKPIMAKMKPLWSNYESSALEFDRIAAIEDSGVQQVDESAPRKAFNPAVKPEQKKEPEASSGEPAKEFNAESF